MTAARFHQHEHGCATVCQLSALAGGENTETDAEGQEQNFSANGQPQCCRERAQDHVSHAAFRPEGVAQARCRAGERRLAGAVVTASPQALDELPVLLHQRQVIAQTVAVGGDDLRGAVLAACECSRVEGQGCENQINSKTGEQENDEHVRGAAQNEGEHGLIMSFHKGQAGGDHWSPPA